MPGDLMSLERDEDKDDKDSRRNRRLPCPLLNNCAFLRLLLQFVGEALVH